MKFSEEQLDMLEAQWGRVQQVFDNSGAYHQIIHFVENVMNDEQRDQVAARGIRWLSVAVDNLHSGRGHQSLVGQGGHVRDQGHGFLPNPPIQHEMEF